MKKDDRVYFLHIRDAIERVAEYTTGVGGQVLQSHKGRSSFEHLKASHLYCNTCRRSMAVWQRLLLILPDGALYDYLAPIRARPVPSPSQTIKRKLGVTAAARKAGHPSPSLCSPQLDSCRKLPYRGPREVRQSWGRFE